MVTINCLYDGIILLTNKYLYFHYLSQSYGSNTKDEDQNGVKKNSSGNAVSSIANEIPLRSFQVDERWPLEQVN